MVKKMVNVVDECDEYYGWLALLIFINLKKKFFFNKNFVVGIAFSVFIKINLQISKKNSFFIILSIFFQLRNNQFFSMNY